jgi:hypothetical protein
MLINFKKGSTMKFSPLSSIKAKCIILAVLIPIPVSLSTKTLAATPELPTENITPQLLLTGNSVIPDGEKQGFTREYTLISKWKIAHTNSGFTYLVSEKLLDKDFSNKIVVIDSLEIETPIEVKGNGSGNGNMRRFDWDIRINSETVKTGLKSQYAKERSSSELESLRNNVPSNVNILRLVSEIPINKSSFLMNWAFNFKTHETPAYSKIKPYTMETMRVDENNSIAIQLFIWTACKNKCEFTLNQPKIKIEGTVTSLKRRFMLPEQTAWLFLGIGVVIIPFLAYGAFRWFYKHRQQRKLENRNETKLHINNSGNFHIIGKNNLDNHLTLNASGDNYSKSIHTGGGDYVQGNYINMSQELVHAAPQIQSLIEQREKDGVPAHVAQEEVAREISTQAQSDPTLRSKLIKWGQSLGDAAISDVVKGVVKLGLRFAGIPLP